MVAGGHRREKHWGVCQAARGYRASFRKEVYFRKKGQTVEFAETRATRDASKRARRSKEIKQTRHMRAKE